MDSLFDIGGSATVGWVKLEDGVFSHPKVLSAGPQAALLFIASLCWSGANNTDGEIPEYALRRLASDIDVSETMARELAEKLVEVRAPGSSAGLWEQTLAGWIVHDWHTYQTTADERKMRKAQTNRKWMANSRSDSLQNADRPLATGSDQDVCGPLRGRDRDREVITPPTPPTPAEWEADFDVLWKVYPRGLSKKAALRCYVSTRRRGNSHDDLLAATENFAQAMRDEGREQHVIKHGSTFFGPDEHWRDYLPGGTYDQSKAKKYGEKATKVDSEGNVVTYTKGRNE